jgi:hypothetical protein
VVGTQGLRRTAHAQTIACTHGFAVTFPPPVWGIAATSLCTALVDEGSALALVAIDAIAGWVGQRPRNSCGVLG